MSGPGGRIWYAAYGSNLDPERFACYFHGGQPPGATRTYPGVRDRSAEPVARALSVPGQIVFAWQSSTWDSGIAFYEPGPGQVLACGYLMTHSQLGDVIEQEMWRVPGANHDLAELLSTGRQVIGPGRYETLRLSGEFEGQPVVTISAAEPRDLGLNPPSATYLFKMAVGLRQVHGLDDRAIIAYLLACPGIGSTWTEQKVRRAIDSLTVV